MKLYSTHCPKCHVLETKIKQKNINCEIIDDADEVLKFANEHNIVSAPILELEDGKILQFVEANKYLMGI